MIYAIETKKRLDLMADVHTDENGQLEDIYGEPISQIPVPRERKPAWGEPKESPG